MNRLALIVSALAAAAIAALTPAPATAQNAGTVDRILGFVSGASAYGYNSCSYVQGTLQKAACQLNRASTVTNTLRNAEQQAEWRQRERFNQRTQQLEALQRACKAGDQESCMRSGGADERQMQVARALMDACTAGDKASCRRADAMMDERNMASAYQQGYRPTAYAQESCQPAYDERTGRPIPGMLRCTR